MWWYEKKNVMLQWIWLKWEWERQKICDTHDCALRVFSLFMQFPIVSKQIKHTNQRTSERTNKFMINKKKISSGRANKRYYMPIFFPSDLKSANAIDFHGSFYKITPNKVYKVYNHCIVFHFFFLSFWKLQNDYRNAWIVDCVRASTGCVWAWILVIH